MAKLPHWAHWPIFNFFFLIFFSILMFGPIEIKPIDLTCALVLEICIIIMLLIFFVIVPYGLSKGPLPSAESVCAVCDWGPSGPGPDVVGCQSKNIYLIQITDEIAVSVYKVEEAREVFSLLVRKIV